VTGTPLGPPVPEGYPDGWAGDVILADGGTVHVRPILPSDGPAIRALHGRLSAETIYFRFFSPLTTLSATMLDRFVSVDYVERMALVAVLGEEIIGVSRYERLPPAGGDGDVAEVAFLVDDAHQGRGLGTLLLEQLAGVARAAGISRFVADTLPDNARMLRVFHDAGFDDERTFADGVVRVSFATGVTEASRSRSHERERTATARSVRRLLAPRSIALVGASRRTDTLGNHLLRTLLDSGFHGPVYPVNPSATHVRSVRAYPSVADIGERVDLAVVAVPAAAVPGVVEECIRAHVGGLVVISSGFAERDRAGADVERRLVAEARRNGMRLVGPNCMGVVNTDPDVRLNATFSPLPPRGPIGMIAQSGALGAVILDEVARRGLGVSTFVSAGNKADVSGNDLLQYWDDDPATSVVVMYIETFGNPRTFARVARRVARRKPIVAVKAARSRAGAIAAGPHRGDPEEEAAVDALFAQAGVIRTDTLEELLDVAEVLVSEPLPAGRRVAIVGNSGGPGVLAADACAAAGLEVAALAEATRARLRRAVPGQGRVANPVDLLPDARPEAFYQAIAAVLDDPGVDSVIALYTSPLAAPLPAVTAAMLDARSTTPDKPLLACVLGHRGLLGATGESPLRRAPGEHDDTAGPPRGRCLPSFAFPEAAARALGRVSQYAEWRRRPEGRVPVLDVDLDAGRRIVTAALARSGGAAVTLAAEEVTGVLGAYGIFLPSTGLRPEPPAADERDDARGAARPDRSGRAEPDGEVWARVRQDAVFGPLVTLEVRRPGGATRRASRSLPLTDLDAEELCAGVLGSPPTGGRGGQGELVELLARLGRLVADRPEVTAVTLGPLAAPSGATTDAGSGSSAGRAAAGAGDATVGQPAQIAVAAPLPHPERALRRPQRSGT